MDNQVDLAHLRNLLILLRDMGVEAYTDPTCSISFRSSAPEDLDPPPSPTVKGIVPPTPTKPLRSDFHNPVLWGNQNGKLLKFDGSME